MKMDTPIALNVGEAVLKNDYYRRVALTTRESQFVLMTLRPWEQIGEEIHPTTTQIIRIIEGQARVVLNDRCTIVDSRGMIWIPAGTRHNVINITGEPLKLYTVYSPPIHPHGLIEKLRPVS